jgi:hypothetical protein
MIPELGQIKGENITMLVAVSSIYLDLKGNMFSSQSLAGARLRISQPYQLKRSNFCAARKNWYVRTED